MRRGEARGGIWMGIWRGVIIVGPEMWYVHVLLVAFFIGFLILFVCGYAWESTVNNSEINTNNS